ncbi:MAG: hypothetical protein HY237_10290 [Acidobacteria bacterium]|nr:hypothetical protein [Acidobacteriota bacterium]
MAPVFPRMRWVALLWLAIWVPAYGHVWGWANFLHICDVAVILTGIGLWRGDALLLSSQAVSSIVADLAWCADAAWRLFFGRHLVGGTEYMWDARFPLWVRLLSLFHAFLPVLLLWALHRVGYDRRGWLVQSALAALLLVISRFFGATINLNYAFVDPLFHRSWGPPPVHLAIIFWGMIALIYWPTHLALAKFFPQRG